MTKERKSYGIIGTRRTYGEDRSQGNSWEKVEEEAKISHDLLKLYAASGPVPVTLINKLKTLVEA